MIPKRLTQFVPTMAETTVYTVPAATYCVLKEIVVANTTNTAQTISMSLVPSGNLVSSANRILPATSVGPNSVAVFDFSTVMATGDFLSAIASASGALTVTISGLEDPGTGTSAGTSNFASTGMVVTSLTRPVSPYDGMTIYETDTDRMMTWNGYSWTAPLQSPAQTLAYAEVQADQGSITTATDLTGLTVTLTIPAGRRLKITGRIAAASTVANDVINCSIYEGGVELQQGRCHVTTAGANATIITELITVPTAGIHTYKLSLSRFAGTGTLTMASSNVRPAFLLVEDVTGDQPPVGVNSVPVGLLAQTTYAGGNVTLANYPTLTTIPGFSINFTVPVGRTVRLVGYLMAYSSTTASEEVTGYSLWDNGVQVPGSGLGFVTGPNWGSISTFDVVYSPSAGAHTITIQARRDAGAGTHTFQTGQLQAEDVTPTPVSANSAPSSTLGYAEVTANQGTYTGVTDITGLTVTVTVAAGRRLRISSQGYVQSSVANDGADWRINEGATILQNGNVTMGVANLVENASVSAIVSPNAGTHTYKIASSRSTGTGNITMVAAAQNPAWILVEDITATSVYPVPTTNGVSIVSSGTRPGSPVEGLTIYETDTDLLKFWNGSNWVTQTNYKWFASGAALSGSPPAIDTGSIQFKMQGGTIVANTDASGDWTLTFPTAFPNGLFTCLLVPSYTGGGAFFCTIYDSSYSVSSVKCHVYNQAGAAYATATLRFAWLAFGW